MGRLKVHWGQDLSFLCVFYPGQNFIFRNFLMVNWSKIWIKIYIHVFSWKWSNYMLLLYRYEKNGDFFYPFLARSNCNMLCLLSVDDVCVLFIVYVRICVAAVNLTLQDSLYCCLPEWVHNEKLRTYLNKMICFPTCFVQFLIFLSWNHLLSEQGRRFSKEDEKFI